MNTSSGEGGIRTTKRSRERHREIARSSGFYDAISGSWEETQHLKFMVRSAPIEDPFICLWATCGQCQTGACSQELSAKRLVGSER